MGQYHEVEKRQEIDSKKKMKILSRPFLRSSNGTIIIFFQYLGHIKSIHLNDEKEWLKLLMGDLASAFMNSIIIRHPQEDEAAVEKVIDPEIATTLEEAEKNKEKIQACSNFNQKN